MKSVEYVSYINIGALFLDLFELGEQVEIILLDLSLPFYIAQTRSMLSIRYKLLCSFKTESVHLQFLLKKKVRDFWSFSRFKLSSASLFPL